MPVLYIIESHLIEVHDPVLCIYLIEEWVTRPNMSILNETKPQGWLTQVH